MQIQTTGNNPNPGVVERRFPDLGALVQAAAKDWCIAIEGTVDAGDPCCVALSGGRMAQPFFNALLETAHRRHTPLALTHYFWADERCVPPTDPESNYAAALQFLLVPAGVPPRQVHRIQGERPPPEAAQTASQELLQWAPRNAAGRPVLELVFLGMGEDGHVASLFPEDHTVATEAIYRPVTASKPPPERITLDYPVLAEARQVHVLISGESKRAALLASLQPDAATPLGRLLRLRAQTHILMEGVLPGKMGPRC